MDDQYNAAVSMLTGRGVPNISMAVGTAYGARANELIEASADQVYFASVSIFVLSLSGDSNHFVILVWACLIIMHDYNI